MQLTGLGARQAAWNESHTADTDPRMLPGSGFLPRLLGGGDRYAGVQYTGNLHRVYLYSMQYAPGEALSAVQSEVQRDLPPDSQPTDTVKAQCEWEFKYHSSMLAEALGGDDADGSFVVTYSTLVVNRDRTTSDSLVDLSNVTSVDVQIGQGLTLSDISC